jgi:hypothetical protein
VSFYYNWDQADMENKESIFVFFLGKINEFIIRGRILGLESWNKFSDKKSKSMLYACFAHVQLHE